MESEESNTRKRDKGTYETSQISPYVQYVSLQQRHGPDL